MENKSYPTVIVTGASRGLGAATARSAARLGASVVIAARSVDKLEHLARQIEGAGGKSLVVGSDVGREEDCRAIIDQALEKFGRIDALINNAGVVEPIAPVGQAGFSEWEQNWRVNFLGPLMLTRFALPHLRQTNGRIVNITSGSSFEVVGGWGAYSTAKAAINQLTKILAGEEPGITTLGLLPGIVDTDTQATIREKGRGRMAESNYQWLKNLYEQGQLLPPEKPGKAAACLALYAPQAWSGEILMWDDKRVRKLLDGVDPLTPPARERP